MRVKTVVKGDLHGVLSDWVTKLTPAKAKEVLRLANVAGGHIAELAYARLIKHGTGTLAKSFLPARFVESSKGVAAGALSDLPYAQVQNDTQTTITGKNGKLAIPLTPEASKLWPRDWPSKDLTLIVGDGGKAVLATKQGDKLKAQYALVSSVVIKGTHYIDDAAELTRTDAKTETSDRLVADSFTPASPSEGKKP